MTLNPSSSAKTCSTWVPTQSSLRNIHTDLLLLILEYLPNFFLLSPLMLANWRKLFEINNVDDEKQADPWIRKIILDRFMNVKILEGISYFELLREIVNIKPNGRKYHAVYGFTSRELAEQLGSSYNMNEWVEIFDKLRNFLMLPEIPNFDELNLKQLHMLNELVARFGLMACLRNAYREQVELPDLKFESPLEFSLLYYEDQEKEYHKHSIIYQYLLNDSEQWKGRVDFSKSPVRMRGQLMKKNDKLVFDLYLEWFSTPKESRQFPLLGCENYLRKLKFKDHLNMDSHEDFLQRFWFKGFIGESELFHSYSNDVNPSCERILEIMQTSEGQIAHSKGNIHEMLGSIADYFKMNYGNNPNEFSKCQVSVKPKRNLIRAHIYPQRLYKLFLNIGMRLGMTYFLFWNDWFFNWKYSNELFQENNFSFWGMVTFYALDCLSVIGYPFKAIYSLYHGFFFKQHVTLLECFGYFGLLLFYMVGIENFISFRFNHKIWESKIANDQFIPLHIDLESEDDE